MSFRVREALFAIAFLVAGLGASADLWARDRAYFADFARDTGLERVPFHVAGASRTLPLDYLRSVDEATRAYVLCDCEGERELAMMRQLYNADELRHLRDVQSVFGGVHVATAVAALAMLLTAFGLRAGRLRRAALLDAAVVLAVGVAAAAAFEPAFLLFHRVFFPQGNFLFDPSRDNLVLLYPEEYWLGVTLRLGATFILVALLFAGLMSVRIRFDPAPAAMVRSP